MSVDVSNRAGRSIVPGLLAVAATYVYFLLFAQYGLVRLIGSRGGAAADVDRAMALMGVAGLLASFGTAALLRRQPARLVLPVAFGGCAASACLALLPSAAVPASALVGLFTGMLTVALATQLRALLPGPRFGLWTGVATGLAYAVCNLPPLFEGPPALQTLFCAAVALAGLTATMHRSSGAKDGPAPAAACPGLRNRDLRGWGFASLVLGLLALVWLDSTAFATIQHTDPLKGRTWGGPTQQLEMGLVHLAAAVAAGWLVDRGAFRGLLLGTFVLFAAAFRMLDLWGAGAVAAGPLYAMGISTYSVVLVLVPSARPDAAGLVPARWRAALLFGIAGWLGSALGVGMAQHLHRLPPELIVAAGLVLAAGSLLAHGARFAPAWRAAGLVPLGALAGLALHTSRAEPGSADPVARGRQVYLEEGCITCHSQYIRPRTRDVEWWGPYRAPDFAERPPLIGNRRQGPDLMNVGLRRSTTWQRRHLVAPRAVAPGSRMPSYAHLFAAGSTRGEDLVAYLDSLGATEGPSRLAAIQSWRPPESIAGHAADGAAVFARHCTPCHGADGRGDGPEAVTFARPAMNLRKGPFWYVPRDATPQEQAVALARIVRFGVPGTSMPGHESFTDRQLADVVSFVQARMGRQEEGAAP